MEKGEFVSDDIVTAIIRDAWSAPACKNGFILDGYPRNAEQAETVGNMFEICLSIIAARYAQQKERQDRSRC
jgi:adenylate kinase